MEDSYKITRYINNDWMDDDDDNQNWTWSSIIGSSCLYENSLKKVINIHEFMHVQFIWFHESISNEMRGITISCLPELKFITFDDGTFQNLHFLRLDSIHCV